MRTRSWPISPRSSRCSLIGALPDGHDHEPAVVVVLGALDVDRPPPAVGARLAQPGAHAAQHEAAVVRLVHARAAARCRSISMPSSMAPCSSSLRAGISSGPRRYSTCTCSQPGRRRAARQASIATSPAPTTMTRDGHRHALAAVDAAQELDAVVHALVARVLDRHVLRPPRADRQQHRVVALLQLVQRDARAEARSEVDGDARAAREHPVDVLVEHLLRAAEGGDAPRHVAAEHVRELVEVDGVPRLRQVLRRRQPGRAAADDADGLRLRDRHRRQPVRGAELVHHVALEVADRERAVGVGAAAGGLARGVAHAAADGRERVRRRDRLERLLELALPDVGDVARRVRADGTGHLARRGHEVRVVDVVARRELRRHGRRRDALGAVDVGLGRRRELVGRHLRPPPAASRAARRTPARRAAA